MKKVDSAVLHFSDPPVGFDRQRSQGNRSRFLDDGTTSASRKILTTSKRFEPVTPREKLAKLRLKGSE